MAQETGSYSLDIFTPEELTKYPVTLGEGGGIVSLPPFVVSETGLGQGSYESIFGPGYTRLDLGFGTGPSTTLGGSSLQLSQPGGTGTDYATPLPSSGQEPWTNIYNQELARLNEIRAKEGKSAVSLADKMPNSDQSVGEYLIQTADKGFQWEQEADASKAAAASRNAAIGATSQKLGIPVILPLPVSPTMGAILTAAGLLASGGKVATIDPANPVQSTKDVVTGTVNTIGNIPSQIGSIFSGPTAAGAPEAGAGLQQVTPIVIGAGAVGGQSTTTPTTTVTPGSLGGPASGETTQTTTPLTVVTPGTGTSTTTPTDAGGLTSAQGIGVLGQVLGGVTSAQQTQQAAEQAKTTGIQSLGNIPVVTGTTTTGTTTTTTDTGTTGGTSTGVVGTGGGTTTTTSTDVKTTTGGGGGGSTGVVGTGTGGGTDVKTNTGTPVTTGGGGGGGAGVGTSVTPIFTGTSTYKPMAYTVAQRNLPQELSTSTSALFGNIPQVNAAGQPTGQTTNLMDQYMGLYNTMLGQTSIPAYSQQALSQLGTDAAKLQRVQSGQLSAEDVRQAQQGAREAYAARGQVMGQPAIGAEILNREAIRQQRENEARAAYQASMGNVMNAAQLQTGNIFSPIGSLVSGTFNPLSPYETDVYGTNVNALNAANIAEANRAAALEAAKQGQMGTYAQAFGTFLGSPTGQSGIQSLVDWLMGQKKTTPGT